MALDRVTSFYAWNTLQIQVNVCDTVQLLAGILQCNGGKLEEAEAFKCVFVVWCVRIEIDQLQCVNCWVIISCLSVSFTKINQSRKWQQMGPLIFAMKMVSAFYACCIDSCAIHTRFFHGSQQYEPSLDCSLESILIWVHTVCKNTLPKDIRQEKQMTYIVTGRRPG